MTETYDVVINGGGPVGMGLAIELGQRGIRTCVIERHPEPQPVPKGQNLTQRTCEHFGAWGCEDEIRTAHPIPEGGGIGGMTSYGTLLSGHNYDWLNRAKVKDFYFTANARLPQYATERVLRARAAQIDAINIHYGWTGTALTQTGGGVTLQIVQTKGLDTKTVQAKYAVGCDGSRSLIRDAAGISEIRSEHNRLMALIVFTSQELHELLKRYPGKAFYNVLHPDFEGYWQFFGRVDHGLSWFFHAPVPLGTTKDHFDFRTMLHGAVGQEFELSFDYIGFWDLRVSMANTFRAGHAFIAGDAAHSHPPYGGYGINTGFEDARNLGWKLAAVLQGQASPDLLDSYDEERRPVFASTASDFIERFIKDDHDFLQTHRPDDDPETFEKFWQNRNLDADEVNAFEPNYEGGSTISDSGPASPSARGSHKIKARPGHHLSPPTPDSAAAVATTFGPGFTLLTVDPDGADAKAFGTAAQALGTTIKTEKMQADWRDGYQANTILIRPDTFVAWAGDAATDAHGILARALGHKTS